MEIAPYASANGLPVLYPKSVAEAVLKSGQTIGEWINVANAYRCPLGCDPGKAWILTSRRTAQSLSSASEVSLTLGSGTQEVKFPTLQFVRADRLTPGDSNQNDAPYLVELADVRHTLRMSFINKAYNVRPVGDPDGDYFDDTMNAGVAWTWATLFADLWEELPAAAGAAPTLPLEPEGTPERLRFNAVSAWDAIGQVLAKIGCAVRYDPIGDEFTVVEVGGADTTIATLGAKWRNDLTLDSESFEGDRAKYPETLKICFPALHPGADEENLTETPYHVIDYSVSDYATDAGVTLSAVAGTERAIFDPVEATFDGGTDPTNLTDLEARAEERGQQFYRTLEQNSGGRRRATYRGLIADWKPGKQIQEVWWRQLATGCETVILRYARGESGRIEPAEIRDDLIIGKLTTALTSPGSFGAVTTATGQPYRDDGSGSLEEDGEEISLINTNPAIEGSVDDWFVAGRWKGKNLVLDTPCPGA